MDFSRTQAVRSAYVLDLVCRLTEIIHLRADPLHDLRIKLVGIDDLFYVRIVFP